MCERISHKTWYTCYVFKAHMKTATFCLWWSMLPLIGNNKKTTTHRHLPSIFANIHELEFASSAPGDPASKAAIAMKSGEMERVRFVGPCSCEGPVGMRSNPGVVFVLPTSANHKHSNDMMRPSR